MIEFYNSDSATRAANMFLDLTKNSDLNNKAVLVMTLIAYKGESSGTFLRKVFDVNLDLTLIELTKQNYIKIIRTEGRTKVYECVYSPKEVNVFSEDIMYVFSNALFNIGKYIRNYKISSWNILASIVELPLRISKNGAVPYEYDMLSCIGGDRPNKLTNRNRLVKIGVIKPIGSSQASNYRLNQHAYLLGAK